MKKTHLECKLHLLETSTSAYFHGKKEFTNSQNIKGFHTEITSKYIFTNELYFMEVLKGKFSETFNYRNLRQLKKPRECFLFKISQWFKIYSATAYLISIDYLSFHLLTFKISAKQCISFSHTINGSKSKDKKQKTILQAHGFHTLLFLD